MDSLIIDFMKYEKIMENYMKTGTLSLLNNDDSIILRYYPYLHNLIRKQL